MGRTVNTCLRNHRQCLLCFGCLTLLACLFLVHRDTLNRNTIRTALYQSSLTNQQLNSQQLLDPVTQQQTTLYTKSGDESGKDNSELPDGHAHFGLRCNASEEAEINPKNQTTNMIEMDLCPEKSPHLIGRFKVTMTPSTPEELVALFPKLQDGGHYTPTTCRPVEKTAILIPYRKRCQHLHTLLPVLIPMLMRQNIDFTIYVIEQTSPGVFNKGIMFNAGFLEALNVDNYDCFILHDVDMIPIDDRNMYRCNKTGPIHFSPATNKFNYTIHYSGLFGGVVSFTRDQFRLINGASNMYFGWGGEDDDLRDRALAMKLKLLRKNLQVGVYDMVRHLKDKGWEVNPERLKLYGARRVRQKIDGLSSLRYTRTGLIKFPIYTWLGVAFNRTQVMESVPKKLVKSVKNDLSYLNAEFTIIS